MASTSITRLRIRRLRFLPAFFFHTLRTTRQLKRSPGFLGGYTTGGSGRIYWTVTVWSDLEKMRTFRRTGAHLKAMPKLLHWCDEAAVAMIEESGESPPPPAEAAQLLETRGRISKVNNPSPAHRSGGVWPDNVVPGAGLSIRPQVKAE